MTYLRDFIFKNHSESTLTNIERKKNLQKLKIIKHLYFEGETTNRKLCNTFKFSLPTSMLLLKQLIKEGIVEKRGQGDSVGGRKPDLFGLDENTFLVLSIHIERFKIRMVILNNAHNILFEQTVPIIISANTKIVDIIFDNAKNLISKSKINIEILMGVGVSMPGLVSTEEGKNLTYFLEDQEENSLKEALEKRFLKPVVIFNDANSACLAEFRFGLAKNKKNVLVISMDWGIGLGIIMGGRLQTGTSGFAGELGHIPIVEDGILCYCGKAGCLETVASGIALVSKAKEHIKDGRPTILSSLINEDLKILEPDLIIEAANQGDQFSINLLSEIGSNLGKGIAILIQIFNPELIILGGQIAEAAQFITTPVQQSINTYAKIQLKDRTEVILSELGKKSSLLGVSQAVMDQIFTDRISALKSNLN